MRKVNVFVSSTCFDLSQIRADLHDFIENIGHNPVLSEFKEFPIDPTKRIVDNCLAAVKNGADIFVLIVGNRYGSEIEDGRSITNTEFLAAKNKGIPIYVFINKGMLNILSVWKKNKGGDFSEIVDTTKIFDFISELRDESKLWVFPFENAQDIIPVLKIQLSYLFRNSLEIRARFNSEIDDLFKEKISGAALKILLEKGKYFETEFFSQTLVDEIKKKERIRTDYRYTILLQSKIAIYENSELLDWARQRFSVFRGLLESLNRLFKEAFPIFYGEVGLSSDLKGLYYISETYARIYESMLVWTIETISASVNDECKRFRDKLAKLSEHILEQIWKYPFNVKEELHDYLENNIDPGTNSKLKLTLFVEIENIALEEYKTEFENLRQIILNESEGL